MSPPTIVTAYYRMKSKHSIEEYDAWINTFAETLENPVVFFGEEKPCERFLELRGKRPTKCYPTPFRSLRSFSLADWDNELATDKYGYLHSTDLFIVWNEKPAFMERAIAFDPFESSVFAWIDVGCFRGDASKFAKWPSGKRFNSTEFNRINAVQVQPFELGDKILGKHGLPADFHGTNRIGGGIMLGNKTAWSAYVPAFYEMVWAFVKAGRNCGLDQNAISALAAVRPDLFNLIVPPKNSNAWLYLQDYFAN